MATITPVLSYPAAGVTTGSLVASTAKLRVNLYHGGLGNVVAKLIRYGADTNWYPSEYEWAMAPGDRAEQNVDVYGGSDRFHILMEGGQTPSGFVATLTSLTTPGSVAGAPELHAADHLAGGADPLLASPGAIGGTTPGTGAFTALSGRNVTAAPAAASSGVQAALTVTGAADTGQTASTEKYDVRVNMARTVTWATGALTTQRSALFEAPTLAFAGASTVTKCATVAIDRAPQAGTNATLTAAYALWVQAGKTQLDGDLALGANTVIGAGNDVTCAAGDSVFDLSLGTGIFKSTSGTNTLMGNVVIDGSKTLTTGTGLTMINGPLAAGATALSIADPGNAGAISVVSSGVCNLTSAGAETRTLAIPTFVGQEIALSCNVDGGDNVVTVASAFNQAANTTITLNDAGDYCLLQGVLIAGSRRWRLVVNDGCTLG